MVQICDSSRSHFVIPVRILNKDGVNLREFHEYSGGDLYDACFSHHCHDSNDDGHDDSNDMKIHILQSMMASHNIHDSPQVSVVSKDIPTANTTDVHTRSDDHADDNAGCNDNHDDDDIKINHCNDDNDDNNNVIYYEVDYCDYDDDGNRVIKPTSVVVPLPTVQELHKDIRGIIDELDRDIMDVITEIRMK